MDTEKLQSNEIDAKKSQFQENRVSSDRINLTEKEQLQAQNQAILQMAKNQSLYRGNLQAASREITKIAADALEVERVSAWLYKEENSRILCINLYERSRDRHSEGMELEAVNYPAYFQALEEKGAIATSDPRTDPRTQEFSESYFSKLGITSRLDAPIFLNDRMVGVICCEHIGNPRQWTVQEEQFAENSANFLALAIESSERVRAEAERREREQSLLIQYYDRLEEEVEERTAELIKTNEKLQAEITKRTQTEAELRQQKQEQEMIFNSVPALIWRKDTENRILKINQAAAEATGMPAEVQEGKSLYEIFPEQAEQYYQDDLEVIQSGNPKYGIVEPLKTASGEMRWIRTDKVPYRDAVGNIIGIIVFAVDLTDMRRVEEQLRQYQNHLEELVEARTCELQKTNEQLQREISDRLSAEAQIERSLSLLHATLESTADGILAVSNDKQIVTYNQKFLEMWGLPDEVMRSDDFQNRLAVLADRVKDPEAFLKRLQELYAQPEARGYDLLEMKDGRIFERYSLPQRLGEQIIGRVWNFRDITRFK